MRARSLALVVVAALAAPGRAAAPRSDADRLRAELDAARRTRDLVAQKLVEREDGLRGRVRSLYKLARGGVLPLWVDERARGDLVHRRAAARRMILRDLDERRLLRAELVAAEADVERLAALARDAEAAGDPPDDLVYPVSGDVAASFGAYQDRATRARLVRRGLEIASDPGETVLSVAPGTVLYAGPLRGLGEGVVIDHGSATVSVTAELARARVSRGYRVEAGIPVGDAAGRRIYLELRRAGRPVDPAPLLGHDD